jgi:D-aminopeptidase
MTPLFQAAVEATEEAIINSLFAATSMTGHAGRHVPALPIPRTLEILKTHNRLDAPRP